MFVICQKLRLEMGVRIPRPFLFRLGGLLGHVQSFLPPFVALVASFPFGNTSIDLQPLLHKAVGRKLTIIRCCSSSGSCSSSLKQWFKSPRARPPFCLWVDAPIRSDGLLKVPSKSQSATQSERWRKFSLGTFRGAVDLESGGHLKSLQHTGDARNCHRLSSMGIKLGKGTVFVVGELLYWRGATAVIVVTVALRH